MDLANESFSVLVSLLRIAGSLKLYPIRPDVILYISRINVVNCFLGLITNMHTINIRSISHGIIS